MELVVTYSAALERRGLCPSLSGYIGGSAARAVLDELNEREPRKPVVRQPVPEALPGYGEVYDRIRRGHSLRRTAMYFRIRVSDVRRLLAKRDVEAAGRARRKASA